MNEPIGRLRIAQPGARTADRIRHPRQRLILADHALAQAIFHGHQLVHFAFEHLRDWNAGPFAHDLGDVFLVHFFLEHARLLGVHLGAELLDLRVELRQLAVL